MVISSEGVDKEYNHSFTLSMLIGCQASEAAIQGEIYEGFCMKIYNRVAYIEYIKLFNQTFKYISEMLNQIQITI